jgi:hypothetical protein
LKVLFKRLSKADLRNNKRKKKENEKNPFFLLKGKKKMKKSFFSFKGKKKE